MRTGECRRNALSCLLPVAGVVLGLAGCASEPRGTAPEGPGAGPAVGAAAVWVGGPDQELGPSSTVFTALVSRLGCNSGVTGEVLSPDIRVTESDVIVTFSVAPERSGAADCQGNDQVPYEVSLPEPLGDRALVDGQCLDGGEAGTTSFCQPDGTRWAP